MFTQIIKLSLMSLLIVGTSAEAARVVQSKNNKVMIDLEGEEATPQQDISLYNAKNK
ncbi:MAG: hypothetical protein H7061_09235, partial [Bdellovibrionaceae bacterium]|nr:hypothetical protein [Bdellovibrio sp.]